MLFFTNLQMMFSALTKPQQQVTLPELPPGRVLDIGGGGEGVIAQVGGSRVVAVDKLVSEIGEACDKALAAHWLVADATQLPCPNESFAQATAFFSCMYMSNEVKAAVFKETCRVLQPGGEFWQREDWLENYQDRLTSPSTSNARNSFFDIFIS